METSLALQLQQAWLQTQMTKFVSSITPKSDPDDIPFYQVSGTALHMGSDMWSPHQDLQSSLSFASTDSVYRSWDAEAESLNDPDPCLQYINDILMEEDLEDQKCMMQECSAYQAMAKGFYEILGEDTYGVRSSDPSQGSHQNDYGSNDVTESEADDDWINQVLNLGAEPATSSGVSTETSLVDTTASNATSSVTGPALYSPPWSYSSSQSDGETRYSYHLSSNSSGTSQFDGLLDPPSNHAILPHSSSGIATCPPGISGVKMEETLQDNSFSSYSSSQRIAAGNNYLAYKDSFQAGAGFEHVVSGNGKIFSLHSENETGKFGMAVSGKFQENVNASRTAVELSFLINEGPPRKNGYEKDASGNFLKEFQENYHGSREVLKDTSGTPTILFVTPSSLDGEDRLSFVQNKDLKAECSAKWLREGPLPKCIRTKEFTARKQDSPGANSNGLSTLRAGKPLMVDLRSLLVSCAQAVAVNDPRKANDILQDIREHACPNGSATERMAHYFTEALVARLSGTGPQLFTAMSNNRPSAAQMLKALHVYMANCPFKKVSHYFANYNILKAAEGASRLHIVDYGILYGFHWPSLISALAERKGGPPHLRITGIEFPQPGFKPAERIEETGRRLAEYARTYGVPFEFQAVASKWENVHPASLNISKDEVLVVTCMHRLKHLMDETVMAASPRMAVLTNIQTMNPKIFVEGVMNAGLNAPFFISRFRETLFYFSSRFDYLDTTIENESPERLMIEREMLGREILNIIACEGLERVERPETYRQWQSRMQRAGFELLSLDQAMVGKAQALVKAFYHKDFGVDDDGKWMLLGWKGRIMHALSTWRPSMTKKW